MAEVNDIADAVVNLLNAGSWSMAFVAERGYVPQFDLQDMAALKVQVVPRSLIDEVADRARNRIAYQVDIGVMKKPPDLTNASLDPLTDLVEAIAQSFRRKVLANPAVRCMMVVNDPIFSPQHLRELRQFSSVITLTFWDWK